MSAGRLIVGFHGCDITTRDDLVAGRLPCLTHSQNQYDWLGPGAYFFEADAERAHQFACRAQQEPHKRYSAQPIATPAVVGALLSVQACLDLTTQEGIEEFGEAAHELQTVMRAKNIPMPRNVSADTEDFDVIYRALDRAVIAYLHERRIVQKQIPYDAVRGAFTQGTAVIEGSAFRKGTHIQLALRNDKAAVAWFLPRGARLLDPPDHALATQRLHALRLAGKPHVRRRTKS